MALNYILVTIALIFIQFQSSNTVSSDVTQPKAKTVKKGDPVTLTIQKNLTEIPQLDDIQWQKDDFDIILYDFKTSQMHSYKERVDFNTEDFTLTLKNTQETDSGLYTAKASGETDSVIALYNVTVVTHNHGSSTGPVRLTWIMFVFLLGAVMI